MNLKSCNKVETNRYQLEVEVDEQSFNDALNRTYHKEIKKISLPGFRKGKAPRSFVEKYYGEQVFYEGAVNDIFPVAFEEAVKESKLDVITDNNDFEIVEIGKQGFTFKISVITKPEVNIANYKGLKIEPKDPEVKEEDIDAEINKTLDRYSRMVTMDKAAENDDIVVMDFEGSIDGVPFEGGAAENYSLTLGTKMFIPGFEDQLLGHKAGDEVDVNVSFPEDYHAAELAGKPALFKVKIHEIKGKETTAFDDEFVKDISEFDTVAEYREDVRKKLDAKAHADVAADIDNQLMEQLNDLLEAEIPEAMIELQIDEELRAFNFRLQSQGLKLETYMQLTGTNPKSLREQFREQAERQVKIRLALEKIGQLENITASDEEIEEEYKNLSELYKTDIDKVKAIISREGQTKDIIARKAMNLVRDEAVVEVNKDEKAAKPEKTTKSTKAKAADKEADAEKEAAPKKKPAAKKTTTKKAADGEEKPAAKKTTRAKKTETKDAE